MEEVSSLIINAMKFLARILKGEYTRTKHKNIGKARFPSLLMELWSADAVRIKTNIVKSFMKAGVFPLNPHAINRSRILKGNKSLNAVPSTVANSTSEVSNLNPTTNSSSLHNLTSLNDNSDIENNCSPVINASPSPPLPLFASTSSEAIAILDRVLEETRSNPDDEEEEDDDEEYIPPKTNSSSSKTVLSAKTSNSQRNKSSIMEENRFAPSDQNRRRQSSSSKSIYFDSLDENGKVDASIRISIQTFF